MLVWKLSQNSEARFTGKYMDLAIHWKKPNLLSLYWLLHIFYECKLVNNLLRSVRNIGILFSTFLGHSALSPEGLRKLFWSYSFQTIYFIWETV